MILKLLSNLCTIEIIVDSPFTPNTLTVALTKILPATYPLPSHVSADS